MARVCDAECKDSQSSCFARRLFRTVNAFRRCHFQPPAAVGFSFSIEGSFWFWNLNLLNNPRDQSRILKLIVSLYGLIHSVIAAWNILKNFATKNISNVLYYPRSMISDICLIRCCSCGESKSIFRPLNMNKYLCIDCSNYFLNGPIAQLDKASVYGTED